MAARRYRDTLQMAHGLEAALEMEREKYEKAPVRDDLAPQHVIAQGWCYVVSGYALLEMGLKALLQARGTTPPGTHSLLPLFGRLEEGDQEVLSSYYDDFRATVGGRVGQFPIKS